MNPMRTDGGEQRRKASRTLQTIEVLLGSCRADGSDMVVGDNEHLKIAGCLVTGKTGTLCLLLSLTAV